MKGRCYAFPFFISMLYRVFILLLCSSSISLVSQQTVGTLLIDDEAVDQGFTLFYPNQQSTVFLINNCGEIVNTWQLDPSSRPGSKSLLDSLGNLYVCSLNGAVLTEPTLGTGGAGGLIEQYDWNGTLLWQYKLANDQYRQHHDIELLPSGNVIMIAWERHRLSEIVEMGFDTINNPQKEIWSDAIFEVDPTNDSIVWEWHAWDHLIQDFDSTKMNYGSIREQPHRLDINYQKYSAGRQDWLHCNSIDYNPRLDQIVISSKYMNEFYIIDHSTTSLEASLETGGNSMKGGSILYRWGNPEAYQSGSQEDRQSFFQHDVAWSDIDSSDTKLYFYNNWVGENLSLGNSIVPVFDQTTQSYAFDSLSNQYLPLTVADTYSHPDTSKNFSTAASSIQLLPNGNVLMCAGRQGRIFEVTDNGDLVWEYLVPMRNGFPIEQGEELSLSENFTFQAKKYAYDFFKEVPLDNLEYIESSSDKSYCVVSSVIATDLTYEPLSVYPNPSINDLTASGVVKGDILQLYNISGQLVLSQIVQHLPCKISVANLPSGIYLLKEINSGRMTKCSIICD